MDDLGIAVVLKPVEVSLLRRVLAEAADKKLVDAVWATKRIRELDLLWRAAQENQEQRTAISRQPSVQKPEVSETREQAERNRKGQLVLGVWGKQFSASVDNCRTE
jgi:hypothetical protein